MTLAAAVHGVEGENRTLSVGPLVQSGPASDATALAVQRQRIWVHVAAYLASSCQTCSPFFLVANKVCKRWHGFFASAARRAAVFVKPRRQEVVLLHVGGCGTALGFAAWELFCLEHGLDRHGAAEGLEGFDGASFFGEMLSGRWRPRCLFADLHPDGFNESCAFAPFNPAEFVVGNDACGGLFPAAQRSPVVDLALSSLRRIVEACGSPQGFLLTHSLGGGTGSGLGTELLQRLGSDYGKKSLISVSMLPERQDPPVVATYNTLLGWHSLAEHSDATLFLEASRLRSMCHRAGLAGARSSNSLAAVALSSMTLGMRFGGQDFCELSRNLVPYPRFHFFLGALSPVQSTETTTSVIDNSCALFRPEQCLAECDLESGKIFACCLLYRGHVVPNNVSASVATIKTRRTIRFVDWMPTGFKCSISPQHAVFLPGSGFSTPECLAVLFANSSSLVELVSRTCADFDQLFSRRTFVDLLHRAGAETDELQEARQDLATLCQDFEEAADSDLESEFESE